MDYKKILNLKFYSNDLQYNVTVGYFLEQLLKTLLIQGENFNSKRPFGNSGWEYDLAICLVENNIIEGKVNRMDSGLILDSEFDIYSFHEVMGELITDIFNN